VHADAHAQVCNTHAYIYTHYAPTHPRLTRQKTSSNRRGGWQGTGINILRSFRALRLLNAVHSIRQLMLAATACAGTVLSSFGLFMIFVVGYAVMGVPVFHDVKRAKGLTRQANMDTVKEAIQILIRTAGGEDWPSLMYDLSVQPPQCTMPPNQSWIEFYQERISSPGLIRGDCGSNFAYPYFILFSFVCKFAFMPLFAASMVSTFLQHVGQQGVLTNNDLVLYTRIWEELDKKKTGSLAVWKLKALLDRLHTAGSAVSFDTVRMPDRVEKARLVLKKIQSSGPTFLDRADAHTPGVPLETARGADALAHKSAEDTDQVAASVGATCRAFAQRDKETEEAAQCTTLRRTRMVMSFDEVLIMLVVMKFFEEAVNELEQTHAHDRHREASTVGVVREWARVANAQSVRMMLFRQSGGALPSPCLCVSISPCEHAVCISGNATAAFASIRTATATRNLALRGYWHWQPEGVHVCK
jgi:hypothetical protein